MTTAFSLAAQAGEYSALRGQTDLTPEGLARSFAGFAFELGAHPQDPETFLRRKRGDCDGFAGLAGRLLAERGYRTKLVVIMMEHQSHVVCYVKEAHGFLDFNHRADAHPIIDSDGSLEDIANKVAADFRGRWHLASEFKYDDKLPIYLEVAFPPAAISRGKFAVIAPQQQHHRTNPVVSLPPVTSAPLAFDKAAQAGNPAPVKMQ